MGDVTVKIFKKFTTDIESKINEFLSGLPKDSFMAIHSDYDYIIIVYRKIVE